MRRKHLDRQLPPPAPRTVTATRLPGLCLRQRLLAFPGSCARSRCVCCNP